MKIISLSSYIAGPACAIAFSIKKIFYNCNYQTNMFDYLEISLLSINQILYLKNNDIDYLDNNIEMYKNKDNNTSVKFNNFDKFISHHDLKENYSNNEYNLFIEKYKRRYYRLMNDINIENKIFFIRYGIENKNDIFNFINIVNKLNPKLKIYFINIIYDENNYLYDNDLLELNNFYLINFYNYIDVNFKYNDDFFYKVQEFNWKIIYDIIYNNLDKNDKINFNYFN